MIRNFFLVSFRNYSRHKLITIIYITGLVLGFLSSLLILEYVFYQQSFDNFHSNGDQIYRLAYDRYQDNKLLWRTANSFCSSGTFLKENFKEVKENVTLQRYYDITICRETPRGEKICLNEEKSYFATNSIFYVFDFELVRGRSDCLTNPGMAVITERAARKYFQDEDPIGKTITVNNDRSFAISGIIKDIPRNSHLQFDFLFSFSTIISGPGSWMLDNWEYDYFYNYILLEKGTRPETFGNIAFPRMISMNYEDIQKSRNERDRFYLQPIKKIHLYSNIEYEAEKPGNGNAVKVLSGFSVFFAIIAWINYINLVTARSMERAREVGIRKVNGSSRRKLAVQFLMEALMINLISLGITCLVFTLINPVYTSWLQIDGISIFNYRLFLLISPIFFLAGVLLSGIYPALVLSSYDPLVILKGIYKNSNQGMFLRKSLVSFQFFISFILLLGTIICYRQVLFLLNKDWGINYQSTMVIKSPKPENDIVTFKDKNEVLINLIRDLPWEQQNTSATDVPGEEINNWFWCYRKGYDAGDGKAYFRIGIDDNYFDFFKIEFLAGREFSKSKVADQDALIMNESAMRRLGYDSPTKAVDQWVSQGNAEFQIIGIVRDFHYKSVKVEPVPTVFSKEENSKPFVAIKYQNTPGENINGHIAEIEKKYHQVFPDSPFEYFFIQDKVAGDLAPDFAFRSVFSIFSMLAVFIALIGLTGLLYITVNQNKKSIAIRILLGARTYDIFSMLSYPVFMQIGIAMSAAIPVSYIIFNKWITENYVFHIRLNWYYFLLPAIILCLASMALITSQVRRIFSTNLSTSLNYE